VVITSRYFSKETIVISLLLIVEDLTGLGPIVFTFAFEGFPHKNFGVLFVVGCLILLFCYCDCLIYTKRSRLIPL
jgi:hypothetical protein